MENPKISCIITTFNRKKLLKRAIKSVLAQTFQDFELIVVDDCSTEDVEKLVKSFGDKRIKYLKTEKNSGSDSHPKNLGILEAKGEYIALLDDDDCYRPEALKILRKYAEQTGVDVVYGDYVMESEGKMRPGWSIDFNVQTLRKMNYISMSVVLIKRSSLLEVGGFDEAIHILKDWQLWLRMQKAQKKFLHIPIIITEVH